MIELRWLKPWMFNAPPRLQVREKFSYDKEEITTEWQDIPVVEEKFDDRVRGAETCAKQD
jgi:hypothetical protein